MPFRLVKKVIPEYPRAAVQQHVQGTIAVDVSIGADGVPRIIKVVATRSPDLEKSSVNAITDWRYEPATCNGSPVPVETVLRVDYTLPP